MIFRRRRSSREKHLETIANTMAYLKELEERSEDRAEVAARQKSAMERIQSLEDSMQDKAEERKHRRKHSRRRHRRHHRRRHHRRRHHREQVAAPPPIPDSPVPGTVAPPPPSTPAPSILKSAVKQVLKDDELKGSVKGIMQDLAQELKDVMPETQADIDAYNEEQMRFDEPPNPDIKFSGLDDIHEPDYSASSVVPDDDEVDIYSADELDAALESEPVTEPEFSEAVDIDEDLETQADIDAYNEEQMRFDEPPNPDIKFSGLDDIHEPNYSASSVVPDDDEVDIYSAEDLEYASASSDNDNGYANIPNLDELAAAAQNEQVYDDAALYNDARAEYADIEFPNPNYGGLADIAAPPQNDEVQINTQYAGMPTREDAQANTQYEGMPTQEDAQANLQDILADVQATLETDREPVVGVYASTSQVEEYKDIDIWPVLPADGQGNEYASLDILTDIPAPDPQNVYVELEVIRPTLVNNYGNVEAANDAAAVHSHYATPGQNAANDDAVQHSQYATPARGDATSQLDDDDLPTYDGEELFNMPDEEYNQLFDNDAATESSSNVQSILNDLNLDDVNPTQANDSSFELPGLGDDGGDKFSLEGLTSNAVGHALSSMKQAVNELKQDSQMQHTEDQDYENRGMQL